MKISLTSFTPLLFTYTGCAEQKVVRKDDSIAPALPTKQVDSSTRDEFIVAR